MTPRWVLDDGPLSVLAAHVDAAWAWPASTIAVVREVADAVSQDRSGRRAAILAMQASPGVGSVQVLDGGTEANNMLWTHLRPNASTATRDLGEDVAIAICATEFLEGVFVTMDKRAAYIASAELGRARVATPFEAWDALERASLITIDAFRSLCRRTATNDSGLNDIPRRCMR